MKAKAADRGLTLEDWFKSLAAETPGATGSLQSAADIVLEEMRKVRAGIMANMPKDGASQHDHYLYGWPKKEA